jgi:hypothetical protein
LAKRGAVALTVVMGANREGQRSAWIKAQLSLFNQAGIRGLDRRRNADTPQLAVRGRLETP